MAIEEAWYKSAILQHRIDKQSFVYSVPHFGDEKEDSEIKVTASMAIFPRDGGMEAPSCVVGFQFAHELMYKRFMELTSNNDASIKYPIDSIHDRFFIQCSATNAKRPAAVMNKSAT